MSAFSLLYHYISSTQTQRLTTITIRRPCFTAQALLVTLDALLITSAPVTGLDEYPPEIFD